MHMSIWKDHRCAVGCPFCIEMCILSLLSLAYIWMCSCSTDWNDLVYIQFYRSLRMENEIIWLICFLYFFSAMKVGFGQTVCTPLRPKCGQCTINHLCPSAFMESSSPVSKGRKSKSIKEEWSWFYYLLRWLIISPSHCLLF